MDRIVVTTAAELRTLIREEIQSITFPALEKVEPDITDVKGISQLTGWAEQTIYAKHSREEFPPGAVFKSGKKLFFSRSAIMDFIKSVSS